MDFIQDFSDSRLKAWCIQCGNGLATSKTNRDHVPTKSLLQKPYPSNLPVITICTSCNLSFSSDEQYFVTFLSCVLSGSTIPEKQVIKSAEGALKRSPRLRKLIEHSKSSFLQKDGTKTPLWKAAAKRLENVVVKNARGHAFYEMSETLFETPKSIWFGPLEYLTKEDQEKFTAVNAYNHFPEIGSRLSARILTSEHQYNYWIDVQNGIYSYVVDYAGGDIKVRSLIHDYLVTEVIWSGDDNIPEKELPIYFAKKSN